MKKHHVSSKENSAEMLCRQHTLESDTHSVFTRFEYVGREKRPVGENPPT